VYTDEGASPQQGDDVPSTAIWSFESFEPAQKAVSYLAGAARRWDFPIGRLRDPPREWLLGQAVQGYPPGTRRQRPCKRGQGDHSSATSPVSHVRGAIVLGCTQIHASHEPVDLGAAAYDAPPDVARFRLPAFAATTPYGVRILRRLAEPRALQVVPYCRRSLPQMEYLTSAASRPSPAVLSRRV
jgi:hypothetical protein